MGASSEVLFTSVVGKQVTALDIFRRSSAFNCESSGNAMLSTRGFV
jgi:hypothetical protein